MAASGLGVRGIIGSLYRRIEAVTAGAWQDPISMLFNTDQATETYRWLGQTPAMREWIGGRQSRGFTESGISITNKLFELTLELDVDERRRDKTGQIDVRVAEKAERVQEHWHKLLTEKIITPGNSYDGVAFYASTHAEGSSGTQDNDLVAGDVPALNVTTPNAPTPDEMRAAIIGIVQAMLAYKDDQGEPMNASARQFLIMVPTNLWAATMAAVNLPFILSGGQAVNNLLTNLSGFSFQVVINPRLTVDTTFYTFRTDAAMKPFIRQEELLEISELDDSFLNNRILIGVKALRNVGTAYWQYASKAVLS